MKYIVCALILLTVATLKSSPVESSSIDISCEYDFVRTESFEQFVKKEKNDDFYKMHNWWEFHKKRQMHFSINQNTKSVTCGFTGDNFCTSSNTTSDVYPDECVFRSEMITNSGRI